MSAPATREYVTDIAVSTADELLTVLNPRTGDWGDSSLNWVFRGQANADWKLVPSAMREDRGDPFRLVGVLDTPEMRRRSASSAKWSIRRERLDLMLRSLQDALNDQGLVIPAESPPIDHRMQLEGGSFPVRTAFPLMALAQHHRLPTLFLDWTRRAWVAAYFAAVGAAKALVQPQQTHSSFAKEATHLAVWALHRGEGRDEQSLQPYFYEAPASTNPNFRAQSGLFTWFLSDEPEDCSLDEYIAWLAQRWNKHIELRRFVLPVTEARRLLRLLSLEHVNGATMFPGVDGIVLAMQERTLWDTWDAGPPSHSPNPADKQ